MYFEHERGQKYGFWVISIDLGLLVGPLIGGFMDLVSAAWIQWLTAILFAVVLIAEIAFLPETLYPRNRVLKQMSQAGVSSIEKLEFASADDKPSNTTGKPDPTSVRRTKHLPFLNVVPVPGLTHPQPWTALLRFLRLWPFLSVSIPVCVYCFTWYWWILCVITEIPVAYVNYSAQIQGLFFIGLILGTLAAEAFFSGTLSDLIVRKLAAKNGGVRTPEMRLWLIYPAALLTASKRHPPSHTRQAPPHVPEADTRNSSQSASSCGASPSRTTTTG